MTETGNPATPAPLEAAMHTFTATLCAASAAEALERVARRLPEGWATTGRTSVRSARHQLHDVEVAELCGVHQVERSACAGAPDGCTTWGDRNDCWVQLTSYGISPSAALGSVWERTLGATA